MGLVESDVKLVTKAAIDDGIRLQRLLQLVPGANAYKEQVGRWVSVVPNNTTGQWENPILLTHSTWLMAHVNDMLARREDRRIFDLDRVVGWNRPINFRILSVVVVEDHYYGRMLDVMKLYGAENLRDIFDVDSLGDILCEQGRYLVVDCVKNTQGTESAKIQCAYYFATREEVQGFLSDMISEGLWRSFIVYDLDADNYLEPVEWDCDIIVKLEGGK